MSTAHFLNATPEDQRNVAQLFAVGAFGHGKMDFTYKGVNKYGPGNTGNEIPYSNQSHVRDMVAALGGSERSMADGVTGIPSLETVAQHTRSEAMKKLQTYIIHTVQTDVNDPHFSILPLQYIQPEDLNGFEEAFIEVGFTMPQAAAEFTQPHYIRFSETSRRATATRYNHGFQDNAEYIMTAEGQRRFGEKMLAALNDFLTFAKINVTATLCSAEDWYQEHKLSPNMDAAAVGLRSQRPGRTVMDEMFKHTSQMLLILDRPGGMDKLFDWVGQMGDRKNVRWTHCLIVEGSLTGLAYSKEETDYQKRGPRALEMLEGGSQAVKNRIQRQFRGITILNEPPYEVKDNRVPVIQMLGMIMQTGQFWVLDPKQFEHDQRRVGATNAGDLYYMDLTTEHLDVRSQSWEDICRAAPCWDEHGELNHRIYDDVLFSDGIVETATQLSIKVTNLSTFKADPFIAEVSPGSAQHNLVRFVGNTDTHHLNLDDSARLVDEMTRHITDKIGKDAEHSIKDLVTVMRDNFEVRPDVDGNVEGFIAAAMWSSIPRGAASIQANPIKSINEPRLPTLIPIYTSGNQTVRDVFAYLKDNKSAFFKVPMMNHVMTLPAAAPGAPTGSMSKPLINVGNSMREWKGFASRLAAQFVAGGAALVNLLNPIVNRYTNRKARNAAVPTADESHWLEDICLGASAGSDRTTRRSAADAADIFTSLASGYVLVDSGANTDTLINIPSILEAAPGDGRLNNVAAAIITFWNTPTEANRSAILTAVSNLGVGNGPNDAFFTTNYGSFRITSAAGAVRNRGILPLEVMHSAGTRIMAATVVEDQTIAAAIAGQNSVLPMMSSYVWLDKTILGGINGVADAGWGSGDHNISVPGGVPNFITASPVLFPMYMAAIGAPSFSLFSTPEDLQHVKIAVFKPFDGNNIILPGFSTPHALSCVRKQMKSGWFGWDNSLTKGYLDKIFTAIDATKQFSGILYSILSPTTDKRSNAPLTQGVAWWSEHYMPRKMALNQNGEIDPTSLFEHVSMAFAHNTVGMIHPFAHHSLGSFGEAGNGYDCTLRLGSDGSAAVTGLVSGGVVIRGDVADISDTRMSFMAATGPGTRESVVDRFSIRMEDVRENLVPPILYVRTASHVNGIFSFDRTTLGNINSIFGYQVAKQIVEPESNLWFIPWLRGANAANPGGLPALNTFTDITNAVFANSDLFTVGANGQPALAEAMVNFMADLIDWARAKGRITAAISLPEFERQVQVTAAIFKEVGRRTFDVPDEIVTKIAAWQANGNAELNRLYDQINQTVQTPTPGAGAASSSGQQTPVWNVFYNTLKNSVSSAFPEFARLESPEWPVVDTELAIGSNWFLMFNTEARLIDRTLGMSSSLLRPRDPQTGRFLAVPKIVPGVGLRELLNERMIADLIKLEGRSDNFFKVDEHYKSLAAYRSSVDGANIVFPHNVDDFKPNRFFIQRMECFKDWMHRAVAYACFTAFWSAQMLINLYQNRIFVPLVLIPFNPFVYANTAGMIFVAGGPDLGMIGYSLNIESYTVDNLRRVAFHQSVWLMQYLRQPRHVLFLAHVKMLGLIWGHGPQLVNTIAGFRPPKSQHQPVDWDASRHDIGTNLASRFVAYAGGSFKESDLSQQLNIRGTHQVIEAALLAGMPLPANYIPKVPDNTMSYPSALVVNLAYQFDRLLKDRDDVVINPKTLNDIRLNRPDVTGCNSPYLYRQPQWGKEGGRHQISKGSGPLSIWKPAEGSVVHGFPSMFDRP